MGLGQGDTKIQSFRLINMSKIRKVSVTTFGIPNRKFQIPSCMFDYMNNLENISCDADGIGCNCLCEYKDIPTLRIYVCNSTNENMKYLLCKECKDKYDVALEHQENKEDRKQMIAALNSIVEKSSGIDKSLNQMIATLSSMVENMNDINKSLKRIVPNESKSEFSEKV